jgi:integrase
VASTDRCEALRAVADQVTMEVRWDGPRRVQRSYLAEIFDLAAGTGRRITAICSLRAEDLRRQPTPTAPHGAIRWPAVTDKMGRESTVPVSPEVRSALLRVLEGRGLQAGYLFPCPTSADRPVTKWLARNWLRRAEVLAKLEPQEGSAFHAYRRGWATARKHLPLPDVAAAGGWKGRRRCSGATCTPTSRRCWRWCSATRSFARSRRHDFVCYLHTNLHTALPAERRSV